MRRGTLVLALPLLLAACGATKTVVRTVTVTKTPIPTVFNPGGEQHLYTHLRGVHASRGAYLLDVDPALFLSGITANTAFAQDARRSCSPRTCPGVPNDNLVEDESHRTYVYLLPASAQGTVLVLKGQGIAERRIDGAELAKLVNGTSTIKLFEPLESGVWLDVHIDTVTSFAQQYQP